MGSRGIESRYRGITCEQNGANGGAVEVKRRRGRIRGNGVRPFGTGRKRQEGEGQQAGPQT